MILRASPSPMISDKMRYFLLLYWWHRHRIGGSVIGGSHLGLSDLKERAKMQGELGKHSQQQWEAVGREIQGYQGQWQQNSLVASSGSDLACLTDAQFLWFMPSLEIGPPAFQQVPWVIIYNLVCSLLLKLVRIFFCCLRPRPCNRTLFFPVSQTILN